MKKENKTQDTTVVINQGTDLNNLELDQSEIPGQSIVRGITKGEANDELLELMFDEKAHFTWDTSTGDMVANGTVYTANGELVKKAAARIPSRPAPTVHPKSERSAVAPDDTAESHSSRELEWPANFTPLGTEERADFFNSVSMPAGVWDRELFREMQFPDSVVEDLPRLYKEPFVRFIHNKQERDVATIAMIAVLSSMFPNYSTFYHTGYYESNLFLCLLGPFGTGKGGIKPFAKILEAVHRRKVEQTETERLRYEQQMAEREFGSPVPKKNVTQKFLMPGNTSNAAFMQLLKNSGGRGVMQEYEIDSLNTTMSQDWGSLSEIFRQSFQHERLSSYKKTGDESIEIERPYLSVIISGTHDQLLRLMPSIENGLFSRFMYFNLSPERRFINVFDKSKTGMADFFAEYSELFNNIHLSQESRSENPVTFTFQKHQEVRAIEFYDKLKEGLMGYDLVMEGVVNRLGLIHTRIAMILSAGRCITDEGLPDEVVCEDIDFYNTIAIMKVLLGHMLSTFDLITKKVDKSQESDGARKLKRGDAFDEELLLMLTGRGVSVRQLESLGLGSKSNIQRMVKSAKERQQNHTNNQNTKKDGK